MNSRSRDFEQALTQLTEMYRSLALIRDQVLPRGAHNFGLLVEGTLEHLRRLEATVMELGGRREAEEAEAQIWLRIQGAGIAWPDAPTSILTSFLGTLRKGIQAGAEWILTKSLSTRPTKVLKQACDLRVVTLQAGSVQVGIRLPDPPKGEVRDEALDQATAQALSSYLEVACWAGSAADPEELARTVADADLRRILLAEVKRLAPRPRGDVETVELSGRAIFGRHVTLTKEAHQRIDRAIDNRAAQTERYIGELREIDLDRFTFRLRNLDGPDVAGRLFEVSCEFQPELLASAIEALDRRVEVAGERSTKVGRAQHTSPLQVTRLVIVGDDGNGSE